MIIQSAKHIPLATATSKNKKLEFTAFCYLKNDSKTWADNLGDFKHLLPLTSDHVMTCSR